MDHYPRYETNTIDELAPGTCFAFQRGDQVHIGIAISPYASGKMALIDVFPGPLELGGAPGVVAGKEVKISSFS